MDHLVRATAREQLRNHRFFYYADPVLHSVHGHLQKIRGTPGTLRSQEIFQSFQIDFLHPNGERGCLVPSNLLLIRQLHPNIFQTSPPVPTIVHHLGPPNNPKHFQRHKGHSRKPIHADHVTVPPLRAALNPPQPVEPLPLQIIVPRRIPSGFRDGPASLRPLHAVPTTSIFDSGGVETGLHSLLYGGAGRLRL